MSNFKSSDELETAYLIDEVSPIGDEEHPHPHRSSRVGQFTADGLFRHPIRAIPDKHRKRLSTLLRLSAALLLAIGGYFFWNFFSEIHRRCENSPRPDAPTHCESPECVHAASEILYNLDPNFANIDPCDDFDQYVCGGWRARHDMRPDQGSIFAGTSMAENAQTRLRHILEAPDAPPSEDKENFGKLKAAYKACLDESTISNRGSKPLEHVLAQLEDVYSVKGVSDRDVKKNLTDAVRQLIKFDVEALVVPFVSPDDRDPDSVAIFVVPVDEIGLPAKEYYNNTDTVAEYTKVVEKVLGSFVSSKASIKDVVTFEAKLANVTPDTQTREDITKSYHPRTIKETETLLPEISLSDIISALAPSDYKNDRLILGSPSYMESLSSILSETSRETVQFFFKWKIIQSFADSVEDPKVRPLREFNNKLDGKGPQATEERWRKCINVLDGGLPWSLSRFYALDSFSRASKELGDQVISDIKERFVFTLDQTSWMSPKVKKLGIQKVGNIAQKIGYPTKSPDVMDPSDVEEYYRDLKLSDRTFFENQLATAEFQIQRLWSKLGKPTDRNEWDMSAPTVNAYYNTPGNEIAFPAGIMQSPVFYGPSAPLYLTYGAFGAVSGHELSHAFDSSGRHYDETGNYTDWWDEKTVAGFEERAQCFVDQYSEFTVTGPDSKPLHVNGRLTLGENIADAGGLGAAFHAWKKRDESKPDSLLPGLSTFSKEQLFFVSYANWWCSKTTKEAAESAIYNDPHAPKPARIIGTMANSREFKEAFQCSSREPVCKLW
ncbi:M13 family metallopeptidase [Aspergillus glaucus CBS 516.65]|uniref:Endothelin-converting enzyme 1 n=1 Tax=Aspergillus glaucus CBS 516.65 TaxID=1160497 RepID=A0A1L9VU40_ASPGL|nr:hypothetical protein ASPGLDRAFT_33127 [Aspergillus glaucus CBS 516.65]OJJ87414.1 hypothetical protein ASPGLDRAFT_33127 [Aspergillus glaucus CBS 516.65]